MTAQSVATGRQATSCYFRTTTDGHHRKALVQIDERCNLHCAPCFVSATRRGTTMPYQQITDVLIPPAGRMPGGAVTLTGGEPTIHPQFLDVVRAFRDAGMAVGVCTNATTLDDQQISALARIGGVHCNVSMDGFRPESHGRFPATGTASPPRSPRPGPWPPPGSCKGCCAPRTHSLRTASTANYANSPPRMARITS